MLGEGEKRLVSLWYGNGFYAKVYEEADGSFHALFTTPDFDNIADALQFVDRIAVILLGGLE